MILPLPKVSQAFESAGLNQETNHRFIPKYRDEPLSHAGTQFIVIKLLCFSTMYITSIAGVAQA